MKTSLRAVLLDFDGVIADSEPLHLDLYQKVLKDENIELSEEDYYGKYLGLDDRGCFQAIFEAQGKPLTSEKLSKLIEKKHQAFLVALQGKRFFLPGAVEFMERIVSNYFLGIVSGALKSEILAILGNLQKKVHVIVSAEDVTYGKPDAEGFLKAVRILNRDFVPPSELLIPEECVVIEDSPWGIEAAKKTGMTCVALLTSYPRERLKEADVVTPNLKTLKWEEVTALFERIAS